MRFKPSSAHRWVGGGCTGSVAAEVAAYRVPVADVANEGTRLHELAAHVLLGKVKRKDVPTEDWDSIGPYVEDVEAVCKRLGHPGHLNIEKRRTSSHFPNGGTPDADMLAPRHNTLVIWDFKSGRRPVEAEENWQMLIYATMIAPPPGTKVELRIVQPSSFHRDGVVRSWTTDNLPYYRELVEAAQELAEHSPTLVATPSNCTYCKAVTACAAARDVTLGGADMALKDTGQLPGVAIRSELVILRNTTKLMQIRLDALEVEAHERLKSGERIDGCGLRSGRAGKLAWSGDDEAVRKACQVAGVDPVQQKLLTPTQAIKAGVPEALVAKMAKRHEPKREVVTDVQEHLRKVFSK